jgi:hypothetical protein
MPALIQICFVIVTIGLLAIVTMAALSMRRVRQSAEELSELTQVIRESALHFDLTAREMRELAASLRECVPPVLRVVNRFESVGKRAADVSTAVLETLEPPAFIAAAVARGVKSGANHLLNRLMHRFTQPNSHLNEGFDHD